MKNLNLPIGISDFEKLRKNGCYFVDKSNLIAELLDTSSNEVTLITRPRRFGKTLAMSMLASFFDIRKDSSALFQGLTISKNPALCKAWMNQYPTLFLTLKDVNGLQFDTAREMLRIQIANLYQEHSYLVSSPAVSDLDKKVFHVLADVVTPTTDALLKTSIALLMRMMHAHYGKPVILLLDEYDVPLSKASSSGYYEQMLELIRGILSTSLKDNSSLRFAIITGCLRISKESIFTGTNNFISDTISDTRLNEYFGFIQSEVFQLLKDADLTEKADLIRQWYDGYHFGSFDVYCPWDVLNYVYKLQFDPNAKPSGFWKNTSDNAIIRSFIDMKSDVISEKLETLLSGGSIRQKITEDLTYDYLHSSEENLWSILYLTGYLTKVRDSQDVDSTDGSFLLQIPNAEIREIFETTIQKWFNDYAISSDRSSLFHAAWTGNCEELTRQINSLLRISISYHDYHEDFYHAFLAGIFAGAGFTVESNREHGEGRSDIVVKDLRGGRVLLFEVKCSHKADSLEGDCNTALHQIDTRMYAKDFEDEYDTVLCYGISFYRKRCLVCKKP